MKYTASIAFCVAAFIAAAAVGGCDKPAAPSPSAQSAATDAEAAQAPAVAATQARAPSADDGALAFGTLEPQSTVEIGARVAGPVTRVMFAPGTRVKRGQALVEIAPERYGIALQRARAEQARAEAELAEAQGNVERRQRASDGMPGLVAGEEVQKWTHAVAVRRAAVAAACADVQSKELDARDATVRAPFDGVMESRDVMQGQHVTVGAKIASMVQATPLVLRAEVPLALAAALHAEDCVTFSAPPQSTSYAAQVEHVTSMPVQGSNTVTLRAVVQEGAPLRLGTFVRVVLPLPSAPDAVVVPADAVVQTALGATVYVVEEGVARARAVNQRGFTARGDALIDEGVQAGDTVVVGGGAQLSDGMAVVARQA